MSEVLRNYTKAVYGMDAVVRRVAPDQWDAATPCEGWTTTDVVAHAAGVLDAVAQMARTGEVAMPETPAVDGDPTALWASSRDGVLEALDHQDVLHQRGNYWFGEATIEDILAFAQWDVVLHAWDIGQAVGAAPPADHDLAQASIDVLRPMADDLRSMGLMGAAVEVAPDAEPMTQLLGLTGRDPA